MLLCCDSVFFKYKNVIIFTLNIIMLFFKDYYSADYHVEDLLLLVAAGLVS